MNKSITYENKELYGSYFTLSGESNVRVNFSNVNESLNFIVFQAHSHMFNISLYMNDTKGLSEVNGTNLGFVGFLDQKGTFQVSSYHKNVTVHVFISVHGYTENGMMFLKYLFHCSKNNECFHFSKFQIIVSIENTIMNKRNNNRIPMTQVNIIHNDAHIKHVIFLYCACG